MTTLDFSQCKTVEDVEKVFAKEFPMLKEVQKNADTLFSAEKVMTKKEANEECGCCDVPHKVKDHFPFDWSKKECCENTKKETLARVEAFCEKASAKIDTAWESCKQCDRSGEGDYCRFHTGMKSQLAEIELFVREMQE